MTAPSDRELLTTTTAARRLGVSRCTVLRWIHSGKLEASCYPSGQFRVSRAALEKIQHATRRTS